jgi:alcohol dehydrogenase
MDKITVFRSLTNLYHGVGSVAKIPDLVRRYSISKCQVVVDPGLEKTEMFAKVITILKNANIEFSIFSKMKPDPDVEAVHLGSKLLLQDGCNGVIVVGGGTAICVAKGIALHASNGGRIQDYEGAEKYRKPPLPVIAVPTTAGSGSDVSIGFLVHDEERGRTIPFSGEDIYPKASILDPTFLVTLPPWAMVSAGFDALTHGFEALWTTESTVLTDAIAFESIRLIINNILKAAMTDDFEAKSELHLASSMANIACGNAKLGIVHAITYNHGIPLPHGIFNAILLPYGMEYNFPVCFKKYAKLALLLEEGEKRSEYELARKTVWIIEKLAETLGIPQKFTEKEIPRDKIPQYAKRALETSQAKFNVRKLTQKDLEIVLYASLEGWQKAEGLANINLKD